MESELQTGRGDSEMMVIQQRIDWKGTSAPHYVFVGRQEMIWKDV